MDIHWFMTAKLLVLGLFMGGFAWFHFRRSRRHPDQVWRAFSFTWIAAAFLFGAVFFLALLLEYGTPLPRDASQLALIVVPAGAILGLVGGLVHGLVLRSWRRRAAEPDYEDDLAENPVTPTREPPP
jgi:amino acid transporter